MEKQQLDITPVLKAIEDYRKVAGLSVSQFEKQANLSNGAISKWQSGRNLLSLENIIKLSNFMGVSLDWLLLGKSNRPKMWEKLLELLIDKGITMNELQNRVSFLEGENELSRVFLLTQAKIDAWRSNILPDAETLWAVCNTLGTNQTFFTDETTSLTDCQQKILSALLKLPESEQYRLLGRIETESEKYSSVTVVDVQEEQERKKLPFVAIPTISQRK